AKDVVTLKQEAAEVIPRLARRHLLHRQDFVEDAILRFQQFVRLREVANLYRRAQLRLAAQWRKLAKDRLQERAFARAVWADKRCYFAAYERDVRRVEQRRGGVRIADCQVGGFQYAVA